MGLLLGEIMNILDQVYLIRKRITDKNLLKLQEMIQKEIDRRSLNDSNNLTGRKT